MGYPVALWVAMDSIISLLSLNMIIQLMFLWNNGRWR